MPARARLADLLAGLSIAIDLGFGLSPESAMRQCLVGTRLARAHGLADPDVRDSFMARSSGRDAPRATRRVWVPPRVRGAREQSVGVRVLAAADVFQAMTQDRPHRARLSAERAADELQREVRAGRLDGECAAAVIEATGHARPGRTTCARRA